MGNIRLQEYHCAYLEDGGGVHNFIPVLLAGDSGNGGYRAGYIADGGEFVKRWVVILVFVGMVITGFSGAANASDYTVWHQAGTYAYHVYLNSSVGHDYDSTGYADNWMTKYLHIRSVSENGGMHHLTKDGGVMS